MNKKYTIFAAILVSFSQIVLPLPQLSSDQEKVRLATLCNLHAHNALTIAQFIENGHSAGTIIDRDIALIEKDSELALKQKNSAQGFISNKMIPGMFKGAAIGFGAASVIGLVGSVAGFSAGYKVWNESDSKLTKNWFGFLEYMTGSCREFAEYKLEYLTQHSPNKDYNRLAIAGAGLSPFLIVGSLVSAVISKSAFNKNASWNKKNVKLIQESQDQFNRNQAIIAQLKQLKYDNGL